MSMPVRDPMGPIEVSISFDPPRADPDAVGPGASRTPGRTAGPVSGTVTGASPVPVRFDGWLELLAILETAVDGTPADHRRVS